MVILFLVFDVPFKKDLSILKSYDGSKKKGIDILFVLFQSTLWFVALNLPLLKNSKALPARVDQGPKGSSGTVLRGMRCTLHPTAFDC